MIAAFLLAACINPPLFAMDGPACVAPFAQCGCSECMTWTANPTAKRYEILRHEPGGAVRFVGTAKVIPAYVDDDGRAVPADPVELWCFAFDSPFPVEGATYSYEVRGCDGAACGPLSGLHGTTTYIAAPYWCWRDGAREACR